LDYGINNNIGKPAYSEVYSILDYAKNSGVKILDTADAYGNAPEVIGEYLNENPGAFLINTKFKKSKKSLQVQINESISILKCNSVYTYFFHSFNDFIEYPELLNQLDELKKHRLIEKTGVSVYDNAEFEKAINCDKIDVIQLPFNLLDNYSQRGQLLRQAKSLGKELQIRSVFLQGLFFKNPKELNGKLKPLASYLEKLKNIAMKYNVEMEVLALQYVMQQSFIDNIVIGIDNSEQLKRNIEILDQSKLSEEAINLINEIEVKETPLLYPKNWN
jgi:aryl-alcohol dehydrogenase-like predicted oxidoreductase